MREIVKVRFYDLCFCVTYAEPNRPNWHTVGTIARCLLFSGWNCSHLLQYKSWFSESKTNLEILEHLRRLATEKFLNWIWYSNTSSLLVLSFNVLIPTYGILFVVYFLQGSMLTQSEGQSKGHVFWFLGSSSSCCSFDQFLGKQQCKRNFERTCWKRSSWKTSLVYCKYNCPKPFSYLFIFYHVPRSKAS